MDLLGLDPLFAVGLWSKYHCFVGEGGLLLGLAGYWRNSNQLLACNVCLSELRIVWGWFLFLLRLVGVINEVKLGILGQMSVVVFVMLFFPE